MKALLCATLLALMLPGCARMDAMSRGWLSSTVPAYAVVDGVVLEGSATIFRDRTAAVQLLNPQAADQVCAGDLRYTASTTGVLVLHCAGGVKVSLVFTAVNELRGHGSGYTARGPAAFTWGVAAADAAAYLPIPVPPVPPAPPAPASLPLNTMPQAPAPVPSAPSAPPAVSVPVS